MKLIFLALLVTVVTAGNTKWQCDMENTWFHTAEPLASSPSYDKTKLVKGKVPVPPTGFKASPQECQDWCKAKTGCKAWAYFGGTKYWKQQCYLYKKVEKGVKVLKGVNSGYNPCASTCWRQGTYTGAVPSTQFIAPPGKRKNEELCLEQCKLQKSAAKPCNYITFVAVSEQDAVCQMYMSLGKFKAGTGLMPIRSASRQCLENPCWIESIALTSDIPIMVYKGPGAPEAQGPIIKKNAKECQTLCIASKLKLGGLKFNGKPIVIQEPGCVAWRYNDATYSGVADRGKCFLYSKVDEGEGQVTKGSTAGFSPCNDKAKVAKAKV